MSEVCYRVDLGRRSFAETLELQRRLVEKRQRGLVPDVLLFVEHPPTYTLGRGGKREHLLVDDERLRAMGAVFVDADRGGDITFHGPGQIVGYPIFDLSRWKKDVHAYLRALEDVVLRALADLGIDARREPGLTGVWHRRGKLAAIGVRLSRWVSSHGFALNLTTELDYFELIVPCGIVGRGVSSIHEVSRAAIARSDVEDLLAVHFGHVFSRRIEYATDPLLSASPV